MAFEQAKEKYFEKLNMYTPVVDRVHGDNHPEFHEVKDIWEMIYNESEKSESPELDAEFTRLRQVTSDYQVPGDVCESYEAVYNMLSKVDEAYYA